MSRLPALAAIAALAGCTPVVRYTEALVEPTQGRTWFTRFPAAVGGTVGFAVGIPVDVAAFLPAWLVYRSQPKETRDPLSVFLFPSFVLWKVGVLFGTPFDLIEWAGYRVWLPERMLTQQERDAIEREWDVRGNYPEYPVTPIHPPAPTVPTLPTAPTATTDG
jgi:hypothetical protein